MSAQRIFLAGAAGAVGMRLTPLLRQAGHQVFGTTRSADKAAILRGFGAQALLVDVFDTAALQRAVTQAEPDVVIHQLTDLPRNLDPAKMRDAIARNARMRELGTRNLVTAAVAARVRRLVAQSIAWAYAAGPEPHAESDPLDTDAQGDRAITVRGVLALETAVLGSPPLAGLVLRYGQLYGTGTHAERPSDHAPLHVDAAAYAALLAVERGAPGVYNIAQRNGHVATDKARAELGWSDDFRLTS
jgi:nucleoside-diphosphate-sugar epimerase